MANLMPWRPIWQGNLMGNWGRELDALRRSMDRFLSTEPSTTEGGTKGFWPAVDISESPEGWRLHVDIPGVDKNNVHLRVNNNILTIEGERTQQTTEKGENFVRTERSYGTFERDFTLPVGVEQEKIKASFKNGTLEVFVPKAPEAKKGGRNIPIEAK